MTRFSSLYLLAALGVLSPAAAAAAEAVDTSAWACATCPFEKEGVSGAVEAGLAVVSDRSARFGDYTGLRREGNYLQLEGDVRWRGPQGWWLDASGSTALRQLDLRGGRDGLVGLRLGYAEIPRYLADDAASPFLGIGANTLTLPAGFPAASTGAMPLAASLQPVDLSSTRKRLDLAAVVPLEPGWTTRLSLRHDVRDGLRIGSGSFFSTASQLPLPIDQVTDQLELAATYRADRWHATLGYQVSQFRNALDGLRWANPFISAVPGASVGQLALAPDNTLHQVSGQAAYVHSALWRVSADFAVGRLTQDDNFLPLTQNPLLASTLAALPRTSLQGRVDTYNANVRLTLVPMDALRIHAVYSHSERDNQTPVMTFTTVTTDLAAGGTVSTTPYSYVQDRGKLTADFRGPGTLRLSGGIEAVATNRTWQEASDTLDTTVWAQARLVPLTGLNLSVRAAHAERTNDGYGIATWISPAENPLLRKFNLADRRRDSWRAAADYTLSEAVQLGVHGEFSNDDYQRSPIGLARSRSEALGADVSLALNDELSVSAFVQSERIRSLQRGSAAYATADWSATTRDLVDTGGVQGRYVKGKLTLAAEIASSRSRSRVAIDSAGPTSEFPSAGNRRETLKLSATYQLQPHITLLGSFWHERYASTDWHLDGIAAATVPNLLTLGTGSPGYSLQVLRAAVRYRF